MIIADTSGLIALFNDAEPSHPAVAAALAATPDRLVVSPYVVAELDYLLATRVGVDAEVAVINELAGGAYVHPRFGDDDIVAAAEVIADYRDLAIGITDASIVVLAARYETRKLLTLDHRHFGAIRPLSGRAFKLIPE